MSSAPQARSAAFRGDIQGMRALAVLMVIAAHAGVSFVSGGFAGVDVFFVISGFLITQLLINEAADGTRVSLAGFYARRARRILPAASLVLVVIVIASVLYLSFLDAIEVTKDAIWAALFAANIRFSMIGADYFSQDKPPSAVQHYWSLAVEEQFYVVWPVVIALAYVWFRRRRQSEGTPVKVLLVAVFTLGGASLAWSIVHTADAPAAAYFSGLTRAWELAAGAALALVVHAGYRIRGLLAELLGVAGFALIVFTCVGYEADLAFPGYAALAPVLGTVALLWSGASGQATTVGRVLSLPPFKVIGDWSYSLYLWHWPLLIIPMVHLGRALTPVETGLAVAGTFVLSALTYTFVERPFRNGVIWKRPKFGLALYPVSLVSVVGLAVGGWAYSDYRAGEHGNNPAVTVNDYSGVSSEPTKALVEASVRAAEDGRPIPSDLTPDLLKLDADIAGVGECDYTDDDVRELCPRGDPNGRKTLVVTGDSHARAWIPAFEQLAEQAGYQAYYLVKPQCTAAFVAPARVFSGDPWPACSQFHDWVSEQIAELKPNLTVIATSPPPHGVYQRGELVEDVDAVADALQGGFDQTFTTYQAHSKRVVLVADVPRLPNDPGTCLSSPGADLGDCVFAPATQSTMMREVSMEAAGRAGVDVVDPTPWLCFEDQCPVVIGSTIAYRDRGHISTTRSLELAQPLGEALGLIDAP